MRALTITLLAIFLTACQSLPTPNEADAADYGAYPENYEEIARNYLIAELRDPQSVQIKSFTEPKKRWIGDKVTGVEYGYLVCVEVNSKTLFGEMTGFRSDAVLIRNGEVVEYAEDGELISGMKLCN